MNEKAVKPCSCATFADRDKHTSSSLSGDSELELGVGGENLQFSRPIYMMPAYKIASDDLEI